MCLFACVCVCDTHYQLAVFPSLLEPPRPSWPRTVLFHASLHPHLLVVFYAHAERVNEDGDHDASVKVFTLHDPPQLLPEAQPGPHHPVFVFDNTVPFAAPSPASQIAALGDRRERLIQR